MGSQVSEAAVLLVDVVELVVVVGVTVKDTGIDTLPLLDAVTVTVAE